MGGAAQGLLLQGLAPLLRGRGESSEGAAALERLLQVGRAAGQRKGANSTVVEEHVLYVASIMNGEITHLAACEPSSPSR